MEKDLKIPLKGKHYGAQFFEEDLIKFELFETNKLDVFSHKYNGFFSVSTILRNEKYPHPF